MRTILLLLASNVFMTAAWYGHLRYKQISLWKVILISWGIALFETVFKFRPTGSVTASSPRPSSRSSRK